ncbi:hypothetical protein MMP60_04340 [Acinetobacter sp. ANC 4805]|nr:hypothetical protein [Acinetobacter sp. ANC 4805]
MKPSYQARKLTLQEKLLAQSVFGDKINYNIPRIIPRTFLPWQLKGMFMAPNGNIYINSSDYSENYALESKSIQGLFIHEMAHIMQYQNGTNVLLKGAILQIAYYLSFKLYNPYKYVFHHDKSFDAYNIEQQGDIARDICSGLIPNIICKPDIKL